MAAPLFKFSEAISFMVACQDQAQVDAYWERLIGDGGEASYYGWLKDKYGLSWQIIPAGLNELLNDPDPRKVEAGTAALMRMRKIDLSEIERVMKSASS